jgi:hypothetical protein
MSARNVSLVSFLFLLGACNAILPPGMASGKGAQNPLQGEPLHWKEKAGGVPFSGGEQSCTTWPIENDFTFTATDQELCLKGSIYTLVGSDFPAPTKSAIRIRSNGAGENELVAGTVNGPEPTSIRKVGSCVDNNVTKNVWEQPFEGCVPNKNAKGTPGLTKQSTFLEVADARWNFPAPPK